MFKVFPATLTREGQKIPLIKGWQTLATNDPTQLKAWQDQFGNRINFWGIPCGSANGIVALDIDNKKGNGWDSLKKFGFEIPNTLRQNTPSGGSHFLFKAKPGVHYSNTVNQEIGLDTRGDGGWIAYYGFANQESLAEPPDWLLKLVPEKKIVEPGLSSVTLDPKIANAILTEALDNVRNAPAGEANNTLNVEAFRVGQLVAAGSLPRAVAEVELFKVAKERGKNDYEAKETITSGINGGIKNPITCPFPATQPVPAFKLPTPQAPVSERWTPRYLTKQDLLNVSKLRKPQLFQDWSTEDISITTADGGTGKTTLKLYEAICLALGDRFLGFECKTPGKTLYITGEDTEAKLGAMLGAIMKQMGLFAESPENELKIQTILESIVIKKDADLCLITKDKLGFLHPNQNAMDKLLQAVDDIKPKMIVLDPIASFWGSESALNDMNKAVTKFASSLVDRAHACVEMINHMGKSSSASKDMTQFAGRGGSGLPSNSRVSRVLRGIDGIEYTSLTGETLEEGKSAMLCNVNKFSDGSPLYNVPFLIIREGYLFTRKNLTPQKIRENESKMNDMDRIFTFIKECRRVGKYPTKTVVESHFMIDSTPIQISASGRALGLLAFHGHMGEKIKLIENPDQTIKEQAFVVTDMDGREN